MHIPKEAIIADEKLTNYLLVQRPWDDKSGFLLRAGFTLESWRTLRNAIRGLSESEHAVEENSNEYGRFYRVEGMLAGPTTTLPVALIWMKRAADQQFHFVTLKPWREQSP